ncbi:prepilin-type N-terminal cleavage/methylation domain-containing protein [Candidatus Shapirobacteria bacterium]|nr:prepilin-type N-terminal cleavage/methylation domain-containing protein [Candidatus Shapirobacteria bacterium]
MKKTKSGFTLIELIVVMAILAILSVIGLGSFRNAQIKGRDAQRKNDLSQTQKALELYFNDYGGYPASLPAAGSTWDDGKTVYMKEMPTDPKNYAYCYEVDTSKYQWFRLYAKLENSDDPSIAKTGCSAGCSCGTSTYNYKITSPYAP